MVGRLSTIECVQVGNWRGELVFKSLMTGSGKRRPPVLQSVPDQTPLYISQEIAFPFLPLELVDHRIAVVSLRLLLGFLGEQDSRSRCLQLFRLAHHYWSR